MGQTDVFFLIMLYCISGICMLARSYSRIKRDPQNRYYIIVQGMYIIIYALVPILVHSYVYTTGTVGHAYEVLEYDNIGVRRFYFAWFMSVIGYQGLNAGYRTVVRVRTYRPSTQYEISFNDVQKSSHKYQAWMLSATVCLVIGFVAEVLWTRAYGGMVGILQYASALRSGWDVGITNRYTIFKRFVPLVQFSNIVFLALAVKHKRVIPFLMSIPSFVLSILYLLANDGRAPLVMHLVAVVWVLYRCGSYKTKKLKTSTIILIVIGGILALFLIHNADTLIKYYIYKTKPDLDLSFDILSSVRQEFSFTVRSGQSVFYYWDEHPLTFRLPIEILSGILGILPSGLRPDSIEKLEVVNTLYWRIGTSGHYGGCPPDIIVTGIYTMNLFGVFLLPAIYGTFIHYLDKSSRNRMDFDNEIFFALILYPAVRTIAYTNFDGLTLSIFYVFVGYFILWFADKIFGKEVQTVSDNG